MPKYKSRVNIEVKNNPKKKTKKKGGSLVSKLKRSAPKKIREFVKLNPIMAKNIATQLLHHAHIGGTKGGSFIKKAVGSISLLGVGMGAGALAFREYLVQNPVEASKLAGSAISTAAQTFFGSGFSSGGSLFSTIDEKKTEIKKRILTIPEELKNIIKQTNPPPKITNFFKNNPEKALKIIQSFKKQIHEHLKNNQIKGGKLSTGAKIGIALAVPVGLGILKDNAANIASFFSSSAGIISNLAGGSLGGSIIDTKKIQSTIKNRLLPFEKININKIDHKIMSHILNHATPHEYSLIRGLASKFINRPHPMDTYISNNIGGSFLHPNHIQHGVFEDILRSRGPFHLSEMLHTERIDKEKGMKTGGGLLDGLKHIGHRVLNDSTKISKKVLSIPRSINSLLQRGLLIAHSIEPIVGIIDPNIHTLLNKGLQTADKIQKSLDQAVEGGDKIHTLLHGNI